jgi:hypothetical protein
VYIIYQSNQERIFMSITIKLLILNCALLASAFAEEQSIPISLDKLVSMERQKVLGLDSLTAEKRAGIARLLLEAYQQGLQEGRRVTVPATSTAPQNTPEKPKAPSVIETKIDGDFEGWEGETIVKLMNGQIWQQTEYHYNYHYAFMPNVIIYRSGSGYKMKVDGVDKAVGVEQLK